MVEEKTRGEQLFSQARKGEDPSSGEKSTFKDKLSKMVSDVRGIFVKPGKKDSPKPTVGIEKSAISIVTGFGGKHLDLKSINQILGILLVGLIVGTIYIASSRRPNISSVAAAVSKIKFQDLEVKAVSAFQEIAFYLDQVKTRDIFSEFKKAKPPPPPVEVIEDSQPPPEMTIQEKASNLKLMGISWGNNPKVIIKDESDGYVHFLKEGEKIKGTDFEVKKIKRDEVILSSGGEEMKML